MEAPTTLTPQQVVVNICGQILDGSNALVDDVKENKIEADKLKARAGELAAKAIELVSMVEQFQIKADGENTPHVVGLTRCTVRQCRDLSGVLRKSVDDLMHYITSLAGFTVGAESQKQLDTKLDVTTEALNNILISAETWNKLARPAKKDQPEENSVLRVIEEQPILTMKTKKRNTMRNAALTEMLDTETKYFTLLKTLVYSFLDVLRQEMPGAFEALNIEKAMDHLSMITKLTKEILSELKEKIVATKEDSNSTVQIGETFKKWAPVLKLYKPYVNSYDIIIQKLAEIRAKNTFPGLEERIAKFCEEAAQPDITFFLILPIQRLPRYEMLLGVVLKYTLENHPDYRNLSDALDMVKEINNEVNEKKREYENTKKLIKIEEAIISKKKMRINVPGRLFIRKSSIKALYGHKKAKPFAYFLFGDMLLKTSTSLDTSPKTMAVIASKGRKFQFVEKIHLSKVSFDEGYRDAESVQLVIDNQKKKKSSTYVIYCEHQEDREAWKKDLQFAININKIRHRMRKESILQKMKEEKEK